MYSSLSLIETTNWFDSDAITNGDTNTTTDNNTSTIVIIFPISREMIYI